VYVYRPAAEFVAAEQQQAPIVTDTAAQAASQQLESQAGLLSTLCILL